MWMFDIETLSTDQDAVVLSAALTWFNPEEKPSFEKLIEDTCFVKFDVMEQARAGRKISKSTLAWWEKMHPAVKEFSYVPKGSDRSVEEGFYIFKEYIKSKPSNDQTTVWARGNMDEFVIDHLAKTNKIYPLFEYHQWRDVRTAVDILTGSNNGYCRVNYEGFNSHNVVKHNPIHDCCYDVMMLLYGDAPF